MGRYVVVDLEMCNVPVECRTQQFHWAKELIQIGAVLLDEGCNIIDKFSTYVAPEFGMLDRRIKKLTGITEENLQDAPDTQSALETFANWLPDEKLTFVQWSCNDRDQLMRELTGKSIDNPIIAGLLENCDDCQALFKERVEAYSAYKLSDAVNAAGIDWVGNEHDAYFDAYNTALLYRKLIVEPELKLHPIFESARSEKVEHLGYSFGSLLAGLDFSALPA